MKIFANIEKVHPEQMLKALTMDILATDLADYLVKKGVSDACLYCTEMLKPYFRFPSGRHITSLDVLLHLPSPDNVPSMS